MSKVLWIQWRAMGDAVLLTAPLQEWLETYPESEVHLWVRSSWAPLFLEFPGLKRVWTWDSEISWVKKLFILFRTLMELRLQRFDMSFHFHASSGSSLLTWLLGIPKRSIHIHGARKKNLYATSAVPDQGVTKSILERHRDTLRALGFQPECLHGPKIFLGQSSPFPLPEVFRGTRAILAMALGASRPTKDWGGEAFAQVALRWVREYEGGVVVVATSSSQTHLEVFREHAFSKTQEPLIQCYLDLCLEDLAALFRRAHLFLGNDSGPKHFAAALGLPTVTLFGPENPFEWHPYSKTHHPIFFKDSLPCRNQVTPGNEHSPWCALQECIVEQHQCLKGFSSEMVFRRCLDLVESL